MPPLPSFKNLPLGARLYVALAVVSSLAMVVAGWFLQPTGHGGQPVAVEAWPMLLYLALGTQIAALLPIRWRTGTQSVLDPFLIAEGLVAPGAGVGILAWLATFDGRIPGRGTTWWALVFNRAMLGIAHVFPSLAAYVLAENQLVYLPVRTALYVVMSVAINYLMAARAVSLANGTPFWSTLAQNVVGFATLVSTGILNFSGGILFLILDKTPDRIGYLMAPALFGFILAVRGNVADAQRQTELKDQTLELAAQALDARDRYTESHSIRVAELSGRLGEHLELGDRECDLLRTAGSLHDLGKIGVRDDILNKPGPLTDDEWEVMRSHPDIGADMIAQHSALAEVAPLVRYHHERWDGSGYPAGLKGDVIPFGARILAVADSFDTITGTRLYRRSLMTPVEGVEDISRRAGHWYDPNVVDALRSVHGLEPLDLEERPAVPRRYSTLRLLRANPEFAKLAAAIGISALGDPLTQVAALVTIYVASHDPRAVAAAFIVQALATILMSGALGGLADRFSRRRLIVSLEVTRAALLFVTPLLLSAWWLIIPILFVLAAINSIVQPARQAAVPSLVAAGQVGRANATLAATMTGIGAMGFGIAGAALAAGQRVGLTHPTSLLFVVDGATFALSAALVYRIRGLGGGATTQRVTGAFRRAWAISQVRPHLVVGAAAAFFLAMSFPALLALAYRLEPGSGGQTYSALEVLLSIGIFAGSLLVGRSQSIGTLRTTGIGLLVTGVCSLAIALAPSVYVVAAALLIASLGNPIYQIANTTALVEAADAGSRGSVMASRFGLVQTASILGTAAGGAIAAQFGREYGPLAAYGVLSIGLILLGMFALAAGRQPTNPLHGRAYEEAALRASGAPSQAK